MSAIISYLCDARGMGSPEARRISLARGGVLIAREGVQACVRGQREGRWLQVMQGLSQTAIGVAATVHALSVESRTLDMIHQTSLVALGSCYVVYSGAKDLADWRIAKGSAKITFGLCGIASSIYAIKTEFMHPQEENLHNQSQPWIEETRRDPSNSSETKKVHDENLPAEYMRFVDEHEEEIAMLHQFDQILPGQWGFLSSGVSKNVFTHPELPGNLVKIALFRKNSFQGSFHNHGLDSDIRYHYLKLKQAETISEKYPDIVIPACSLIETNRGPIVIEQRLSFVDARGLNTSRIYELDTELGRFASAARIGDLVIGNGNAGFLEGEKVGVCDFDCPLKDLRDFSLNA